MTNLQEAKLAREAEICYSTLAMVTDYDCWHEEEEDVNGQAVMEVVQQNAASAEESASASEEMNAQAEQMKGIVGQLSAMVGGHEMNGSTAVSADKVVPGRKKEASRSVSQRELEWQLEMPRKKPKKPQTL